MMNENIMVSVIVPVYNVEPFLRKCIESVLAQTMSDFELILVNDGSTDSSGKICDEYLLKDNRISVIHKPNGGAGSARNAGLDIAKGKYIYFMDSDDYIDTVLLEKTISVMEEKQYDWLGFGMIKENQEGDLIEKIAFKPREIKIASEEKRMEFLLKYLLNYRIGWEVWNHIFRKDIITNHNLKFIGERKDFGEDLLFSFMYWLYAESCIILPEMYYHYVQHPDSLMVQSKFRNVLPQIHKLSVEAYNAVLNSGLQLIKEKFEIIYIHLIEWQTRSYIADKGIEWVKEAVKELNYTKFLPDNYLGIKDIYNRRIKEFGHIDGVVSIIVFARFKEDIEQIQKYLNSTTSQTLQKLDIIIFKSPNISIEYTDIRIRFINTEVWSTDDMIRMAITESYGEYIYFADYNQIINNNLLQIMSDAIKYNDCGTAILTMKNTGFIDIKSLPERLEFRKKIKDEEYICNKFLFKRNLLKASGLYDFSNLQKYFVDVILTDHIVVLKEK